jgi:hypothetical protein
MNAATQNQSHLFYAVGAIFSVLFLAVPIHANPCHDHEGGLASGPVDLSIYDGEQMAPRRACPRTELRVSAGAQLTLELDKYGLEPVIQVAAGSPIDVRAQTRISGSYALGDGFEFFASIEPIVYRLLISAYQASHLGPGNSSLGGTLQLFRKGPAVVALSNRLVLPTAIGLYQNAWPVSVDTSLLFLVAPWQALHLHGQTGTVFSFAVTDADPKPRAGILSLIGAELFLWDWASAVLNMQSLNLYRSDLDHLSTSFALRARIWGGAGVEWATLVPVAGADRNLFRSELRMAYRFD